MGNSNIEVIKIRTREEQTEEAEAELRKRLNQIGGKVIGSHATVTPDGWSIDTVIVEVKK